MKIGLQIPRHLKDVEKLTGLSSKVIRLYEDKGLISVKRQLGNAYRVYSPDNVQALRKSISYAT